MAADERPADSGETSPPPRQVQFAGRRWDVRQESAAGNHFEATNVVVDAHGRLFLGIARHAGQWTAAEISLAEPAAHGAYSLLLDSPLAFPSNVVLSFALRRDDEHQVAIELSPWWGRPTNGQFRVQDRERLPDGFLDTFRLPTDIAPTRHQILWDADSIELACYDARPRFLRGPRLLRQSRLELALPAAAYRLVVGFWLFRGDPPPDRRDQRLWIRHVALDEL